MKFKISKDLNRIELHDSSINALEINSNNLIMNLDWAKLENYNEKNLKAIIIGECKLELYGINKLDFEIITDNYIKRSNIPKDYISKLEIIGNNSSENDHCLRIGALMNHHEEMVWTEWNLQFDAFIFMWNNHVTIEEWKNGNIPI